MTLSRLHKHWTEKEMQYLREKYPIKTAKEIAPVLGRKLGTIHAKAASLGIAKRPTKRPPAPNCPMDKALTPAQCRAMRTFLAALLRAHDKNPDLNIGTFMTAYRKYIAGREVMLYDVI